jgi:uncharacterized protein YuzE
MKIEYDPQADALYIQLCEGKIAETVETSKYIYTDVDEEGRPLGIEILFVKRYLAPEDLASFTFNLLGVMQQSTPVVNEERTAYNTGEGEVEAKP